MKTAEERLRFAVEFAQMDLDGLRAGDWLNLREDIQGFIMGTASEGDRASEIPTEDTGGIIALPLNLPPQEMSHDQIRRLQTAIRGTLERAFPVDDPLGGMVDLGTLPLHWTLMRPFEQTVRLMVTGSTQDTTLIILAILLSRHPQIPIKRCPECQVIFYAAPKQIYHDRTCAHRATVRAWRNRQRKATSKQTQQRKRGK